MKPWDIFFWWFSAPNKQFSKTETCLHSSSAAEGALFSTTTTRTRLSISFCNSAASKTREEIVPLYSALITLHDK